MDKRRIAVNTGCVCILILLIVGFCKMIRWDNTNRKEMEEAKQQKELDEKEAEEKAYEQAKEYMENWETTKNHKEKKTAVPKYWNSFYTRKTVFSCVMSVLSFNFLIKKNFF